jgi:hypothetical protein
MRKDRFRKTARNLLIVALAIVCMSVLISAAQTGMFLLGQGVTDCQDSFQCFNQSAATCSKVKANFSYFMQWPIAQEYLDDNMTLRINKATTTYLEITNGSLGNCTLYAAITTKVGTQKAVISNMTCTASSKDIVGEGFTYLILSNCNGSLVDDLDYKNLRLNEKLYILQENVSDLKDQTNRIEENQNEEKDGVNSHIIS